MNADTPHLYATDWVAYNARRFPSRPAVESADTGHVLSWAALADRVAQLAGALSDRFGVRAGDRVVVLADNDPQLLILLFACIRLGAVYVPLNWRQSPPELMTCTTDAEPALVVYDLAWQELGSQLAAAAAPRHASWGCGDGPADLDSSAESAAPRAPRPDAKLSDPAQILYTSGTTGTPKGAVVTLGGIAWHSLNITSLCEIWGRAERLLTAMPLFHAGGLNGLALPVLRAGGSLTVSRRFDPGRMVELLADPSRAFTHFAGVPVMYQAMAEANPSTRFPHGIHAQLGGGHLSPELAASYAERGLLLSTTYGATEMGPTVSVLPGSDVLRKPGSCGVPVQHTQMRIVGEDGADTAADEPGELWIRGPAVTQRYWRRDPDDVSTDGWFRTGDAVRRDEDDFLYLCGRLKDMYKSGGENVFTAEVENVLIDHPDIAEVAVIGVPDPVWGEVGRAVVVARPGSHVDLASIEDYCRGRLARYKTPKSVAIAESLTRNVTGKVQKAELRARFGAVDK